MLERVDGAGDEVGPVVGGDDLDAIGERGLDLLELLLDHVDHVEGVLAVAHDDDAADVVPGAVQVRDAAADLRSQLDAGDVLQEDRHPALSNLHHDLLEVVEGVRVPVSPHHVLTARELEQAASDLVVRAPDRFDHLVQRELVGGEPVGVDRDLVLLDEAADGGDLRHARQRLDGVAQRPVLVGAQLIERVGARLVDERVLEHPPHAGGVRSEFGPHSLGQALLDLGHVLQHPRPRPVDVRPVLKDDVDVGKAKVGEAADRLDLRGAEKCRDDGVGDLVLDEVRRAVPSRVDDHLRV